MHLAVATSKEACLFVFSHSCTKSENAAHDDLIRHPKPEMQGLSEKKRFPLSLSVKAGFYKFVCHRVHKTNNEASFIRSTPNKPCDGTMAHPC